MLSVLRSKLSALSVLALCIGGAVRTQAPPAPPPAFFTEFATHDATTTIVNTPAGLPEGFADVKSTGALTPGRGWTFAVGTIEVKTTQPQDQPTFSGVGVVLPPAPVNQNGFLINSAATVATKQIVVLQARGPVPQTSNGWNTDQAIRWQRYFYGESGLGNNAIGRPATNARAVSVWPVLDEHGDIDPDETRVVICGESFECNLPLSQYNNGFYPGGGREKFWGGQAFAGTFPRGLPSGYIAVYRGNGDLLWTHQFFYLDAGIPGGQAEGACAITDVSIRVEEVDGVMRDVVTYCGISSFGLRNPAVETGSLTPLRPFDIASTPHVEGVNDNGLGQWDGIVGRVSNIHTTNPVSGTATVREFHSVVGGREQDGLWGIFEMPGNRFVVVGSTATMPSPNPAINNFDFPFTNGGPPAIGTGGTWPSVDHCVGTMLVFDASNTRNTSGSDALILEDSVSMGRAGRLDASTIAATVARDVHVAFDAYISGGTYHRIALVGSTNDSQLFTGVSSGNILPLAGFGGLTDGFLVTAIDHLLPGPLFVAGTFQGEPENGGWCGIGSWNEFLDHVPVLGWTEAGPNNQDLEVVSFAIDSGNSLFELRRGTVATPANETPAAMGAFVATAPPVPAVVDWEAFALGSPAGGGLTMDERGRLNVVGSTDPGTATSSTFPVEGGPLARDWLSGIDAVRMVPTMLPYRVGRTDRSGEQSHLLGGIPTAPAGRTGATTPTCSLFPFGRQLDGSGVPPLHRMLIDWQGPHPMASPAGVPIHRLLVDRPPAWQWVGVVVQFGVPTAPPPGPAPLPLDIENWVPSGVTTQFFVPPASLTIDLLLPPAVGVTFAAQVVVAPLSAFGSANNMFPCSSPPNFYAATPAIVFSY